MRNNQLFTSPGSLLRETRLASVVAVVLLAVQLFGNLYEQIVTNAAQIADPTPGVLVDEWEVGSPVYFYMPWVLIGAGALVVLRFQAVRRSAGVARLDGALAATAAAATAKLVLITSVNPTFRDLDATPGDVRNTAIVWAVGNGIAIVAVAIAIGLISRWRQELVDHVVSTGDAHGDGLSVPAHG